MTTWHRAMFISIICIIGMAGAGIQPALASLCAPVFQTKLYGHGDALLAYAPALKADVTGAGSEQLDVLDGSLIDNVRNWTKPKDVYTVDWSGQIEFGCATGGDHGFTVSRYRTLEGLFSFTRDFLRFVDGIDAASAMNFSLTNRVDYRTGLRVEAHGVFNDLGGKKGTGKLKGSFSADFWELHDYTRTSMYFNKSQGSTTMKMQETTYRRARPGDVLPSGAKPFKGGGYALGARITWEPSDRIVLTYIGDRLFGHEWATGLIYETYDLETNKQFVGIDGYLENRPLAIGSRKNHEFHERLSPTHRIEANVAVSNSIYLSGQFNWDYYNLEKLTIGLDRAIGSGRVNVGFDIANHALGGTVSYPFQIEGITMQSRLSFQVNHFLPREVSLFQAGGSILASF